MKVLGLLTVFYVLAPALADLEADPLCVQVPPGEIALFPYPGNCSLYIECDGGIQTVVACPPGLWFYQASQGCVDPEDSGCFNLFCPPGIVDFFPYPGDCSRYIECYNGQAAAHNCPAGLWFNAAQKRCVLQASSGCEVYSTTIDPTSPTPQEICGDVIAGTIVLKPYPGDCTRFYECVGADATVMSCPPYLYFDEARQMCSQLAPSGCDDPLCLVLPPDEVILLPYPGNCSLFFECSNGIQTVENCPPGLWFSQALQGCDYPYSVGCKLPRDATGGPAVPIASTTQRNDADPRCLDGNNDFWPDLSDCTKFIECFGGDGYLMDCPSGFYFNPDKKECTIPSESGCAGGF